MICNSFSLTKFFTIISSRQKLTLGTFFFYNISANGKSFYLDNDIFLNLNCPITSNINAISSRKDTETENNLLTMHIGREADIQYNLHLKIENTPKLRSHFKILEF